jgi:VanZ family protein
LLKNREFILYVLPAILWALAIFIASSIPSEDFPNLRIFSYDKLLHFGVFLVLAFLTYRALIHQKHFPSLSRSPLLYTVLMVAAYGAFDEIHQTIVPGRHPDLLDFLADATGACLAVLVVYFWVHRRRRATEVH